MEIKILGFKARVEVIVISMIIGCLLLPMASTNNAIQIVFTAVAILALGTGLVTPCLRALVSKRLNANTQGTVLGSLQGLQSLGTFIGAAIAGISYDFLGSKSPFFGTSILLIIVIILISGKPINKQQRT